MELMQYLSGQNICISLHTAYYIYKNEIVGRCILQPYSIQQIQPGMCRESTAVNNNDIISLSFR